LASLLYNDHLGQLVQNFVIFPVDFVSVEHAVDCSEALVAIILGFDFGNLVNELLKHAVSSRPWALPYFFGLIILYSKTRVFATYLL
jgi:hypothetical protein